MNQDPWNAGFAQPLNGSAKLIVLVEPIEGHDAAKAYTWHRTEKPNHGIPANNPVIKKRCTECLTPPDTGLKKGLGILIAESFIFGDEIARYWILL
jgi:hypothetical protein